jgi:anti-anti-sigma factor
VSGRHIGWFGSDALDPGSAIGSIDSRRNTVSREGSAVISGFRPDPITVVARQADRTVVSLYGEHDIGTLAELSSAMAGAIALDDADVVVDLSGVQFMGAATATVIERARCFLHARSRELTVRSPSRCAQRLLEACGLTGLMEEPAPRVDDAWPRLHLVRNPIGVG